MMVTGGSVGEAFRRIGLTILLLGGMAGLTGCIREQAFAWPGDRVLPEAERVLSLEELERQAEQGLSGDGGNDAASGNDIGDKGWTYSAERGFLYDGGSAYSFGQLSGSEQIWYRDMERALGTMTDKIELSEEGINAGLDEAVVDKIFQSVLNDHPELFYVEGYSYTTYTRGLKTVAVEFMGTYSLDRDTAVSRKTEIEKAVEEYLKDAPQTQDDYEKIKYVYERLIRDTDYDLESEDNQNIYSVFVRHSSVCQGYAKAFQYLLNRMGVECILVQGKVLETGEGHAWNMVKSNGNYYYVDTTWGDISYQSGEEDIPQISYDYLCITTARMQRTHSLNRNMRLPVCTATADNYFVREKALFEEYDKEQLARLVDRRLDQGNYLIALQCDSGECYETMLDALLTRKEIFEYVEGTGIDSFAYTADDSQLTLTFFMMTNNG